MGKLSSMKLVVGAKKVGDRCIKQLAIFPPPPPCQPLEPNILLSASITLPAIGTSFKWNHRICPIVAGLPY